MKHECRFMGRDTDLFGPEPGGHEIFVFAGWKVHQPVYSTTYPDETPVLDVMHEKLCGIACFFGLPGREQPFLASCNVV
jgi:hypothetical protein